MIEILKNSTHWDLESKIRLARFGLTEDVLWKVVHRGYVFKAGLTSNDPTATHGIGCWGAIHRGLGEETGLLGWTRREIRNFPYVVHPQGDVCIAVLGGNEATGKRNLTPSNRNPFEPKKGNRKLEAIRDNQVAVGLQRHFSQLQQSWSQVPMPMLTYFLVHYIEMTPTVTVRAELSLPISAPGEFVTEWGDRIILTPPNDMFSATVPQIAVTSAEEPEDDLVVPVEEIEDAS